MSVVQNRYDFVLLFDCQDGNPNGDPDSYNSPRIDPETGQGLVSDVCLKRKIRDYVFYSHTDGGRVKRGFDIFVLAGNTLESRQKLPYRHLKHKMVAKGWKTKPADVAAARAWMCENFFDVRAFGAVMSTTEFNCGQVRGPVQLTFARSIDRVFITEHTITRQAVTSEDDAKPAVGTFGRKYTVAYGLYRAHGFINPVFAETTGFSNKDLSLLWKALSCLFDLDRSAARGLMTTKGLVIFKHDSKLGSAPTHKLFESVSIKLKGGMVSPRSFDDYIVNVPAQSSLPPGVTVIDPFAGT
jgi:CRISPR-associated protein Csd2